MQSDTLLVTYHLGYLCSSKVFISSLKKDMKLIYVLNNSGHHAKFILHLSGGLIHIPTLEGIIDFFLVVEMKAQRMCDVPEVTQAWPGFGAKQLP